MQLHILLTLISIHRGPYSVGQVVKNPAFLHELHYYLAEVGANEVQYPSGFDMAVLYSFLVVLSAIIHTFDQYFNSLWNIECWTCVKIPAFFYSKLQELHYYLAEVRANDVQYPGGFFILVLYSFLVVPSAITHTCDHYFNSSWSI